MVMESKIKYIFFLSLFFDFILLKFNHGIFVGKMTFQQTMFIHMLDIQYTAYLWIDGNVITLPKFGHLKDFRRKCPSSSSYNECMMVFGNIFFYISKTMEKDQTTCGANIFSN